MADSDTEPKHKKIIIFCRIFAFAFVKLCMVSVLTLRKSDKQKKVMFSLMREILHVWRLRRRFRIEVGDFPGPQVSSWGPRRLYMLLWRESMRNCVQAQITQCVRVDSPDNMLKQIIIIIM